MEFKAGDRVRVLRFNGEDVDFYGTLKYVDKCMANLFDCTIKRNEGLAVFLPSDNSFGEDKEDYFVLEEDEEDTKGGNNMPTIKHTRESIAELEQEREQFKQQRDSLIKDLAKLREEKAAIEMYLDAIKTYKPMYECVNDKYKYLTSYIKDKALHNPSVSRYIDLVHVIDGLERE